MRFHITHRADSQAILDEPALAPPAGDVANFTNPPNLNTLVITVTIVSMVLVTVVLLLRLVPRVFIRKSVLIDDVLAVAAFGNQVALAWVFFKIYQDTPGWFVHQWNWYIRDVIRLGYLVHIGSSFIAVTTMLLKASIILEWIRLFVPARQRNLFYWCGCSLVALNTGFYFAGIVSENLSCTPFKSIWDITIPDRKCINTKALDIASAVIDLVSDVAITILPQQIIWRLKMSTRAKLGLSLIFSIGLFALAASICRLESTVIYHKSSDSTYWVSPVALWAFARLIALFLIYCIPALPKALHDLGIIPAIVASMRLVTGRSATRSKTSDGRNPASGPYNAPNPGPMGRRKLKQDTVLLTDLSTDTFIEHPRYEAASESTEHLRSPTQCGGILRTTMIQQQTSSGTSIQAHHVQESFDRQNP